MDKEMQAAARKKIQDEWKARREVQIRELQEYNLRYPCDFCRDLEHGSGDGSAYGLAFDSHTIKCPECGSCFWSDES
jgi:hypothetical protein